jgi:hypothetical protein
VDNKEKRRKIIGMIMKNMGIKDPIVTTQVLSFFQSIPTEVLARPIVKEMRENGKTQGEIAISLGISIRAVRYIDNNYVTKIVTNNQQSMQ